MVAVTAPPPASRAHVVGAGAASAVGLGVALVAARTVGIHAPPCPFRAVTGIPCPGCGMTRLADAVAHGHLATAVTADAAGVALLVALAVLAGVHLVRTRLLGGEPARWMHRRWVPALLVALVAVHWATTVVTGGLPAT